MPMISINDFEDREKIQKEISQLIGKIKDCCFELCYDKNNVYILITTALSIVLAELFVANKTVNEKINEKEKNKLVAKLVSAIQECISKFD